VTVSVTVVLTDDQLELIASRVAAILAAAPPTGGDPLVSVDEAARMLGVTRKTVANMLSDGRLTRHGASRRPLVARAEVEAMRNPAAPQGASRTAPRRPARRPAGGEFSRLARGVG
jgi:excisionase family DNA binding protein